MRGRRRSIATTWWALAVLACTAAGPAGPGFALCVADDGHVSLEVAHGAAPCATHYERHHRSSVPSSAMAVPPPHGCVDTVVAPHRGIFSGAVVAAVLPAPGHVLPAARALVARPSPHRPVERRPLLGSVRLLV